MCRLIMIIGKHELVSNVYNELLNGIIKAAKRDQYGAKLFSRKDFCHKDGWGIVRIVLDDKNISVFHYKSLKPIYKDPIAINQYISYKNNYSGDSLIIDFIHARAASRGTRLNILSTQPINAVTRLGDSLYLIHNGSVNKQQLLNELSIPNKSEHAKEGSDSYFLAQYIAQNISDTLNLNHIRMVKSYVDTALNLGVIHLKNQCAYVVMGSYFKVRREKAEECRNYYKLYKYFDDRGLIIFSSSTIIDFPEYRPKLLYNWEKVDNGKFELYKVDFRDGIFMLDKGII